MISLPPDLEIEELSLERRYRSTIRGLTTRIRKLYESVVDRFGEEGLRLIQEVSAQYGSEIAARVRQKQGDMDFNDVGRFLVKVFNGMLANGEITEWSDKRIVIMVRECPYPFKSKEICAAHTSMEAALVKGLNPDLNYFIEKSLPNGDPDCRHVLALRQQVA